MAGFEHQDSKINPGLRPDGVPYNNDAVEIGPTDTAFALWASRNLTPPNLPKMREFRLNRLLGEMRKRDIPAILIYDPINLRYALDSAHMSIWTMHAPARAAFIAASGYSVVWEFTRAGHLLSHLPLVDEIREGGACINYFISGDKTAEVGAKLALQIADLMKEHCGKSSTLAVDAFPIEAREGFAMAGLEVVAGQEILEHARLIKGEEEIRAMRCAIASCESTLQVMKNALEPEITESELWSLLQRENIALGGEWIETRLLCSGPRTNPWLQECGPRKIQAGDLVAFDTDMVGNYGMCVDVSRTWLCGDSEATDEQKHLYDVALDHITHNMNVLEPGISFSELMRRCKPLPEEYHAQRYGMMFHGIGLCDEFPSIKYLEDYTEGEYDYVLQPGMMLCVEAYVGAVGGREGVKLEDQILITETGYENMIQYPFETRLMK